MEHEAFLDSHGITAPDARARCLAAMAKYPGNHWWEPQAPARVYAYHQLHEDTVLDGARIREGLIALLGRPVYGPMVEFHPANWPFLLDEAERAWQQGTPHYTPEEIGLIYERLLTRIQGWDGSPCIISIGVPAESRKEEEHTP